MLGIVAENAFPGYCVRSITIRDPSWLSLSWTGGPEARMPYVAGYVGLLLVVHLP